MSGQRSGVLELAVLGLLHETPMHGYELRKRLNAVLGAFRAAGLAKTEFRFAVEYCWEG